MQWIEKEMLAQDVPLASCVDVNHFFGHLSACFLTCHIEHPALRFHMPWEIRVVKVQWQHEVLHKYGRSLLILKAESINFGEQWVNLLKKEN